MPHHRKHHEQPAPARQGHDRIGARRIALAPFELALGNRPYAKPDALDAAYGRNSIGYTVFARLLPGR